MNNFTDITIVYGTILLTSLLTLNIIFNFIGDIMNNYYSYKTYIIKKELEDKRKLLTLFRDVVRSKRE